MSFAVLAEFPLGTYRAHRGGGVLEQVISASRLHAALLNAAASGPRAVDEDERLAPCAADAAVLEWLEEHPPDGLVLPPHAVTAPRVSNYRDDGSLFRSKDRYKVKRLEKRLPGAVTWAGPVGWTWNTPPDGDVRAALARLCRDVAYLGMAECPVRLRLGEAEATHQLDTTAGGFGGSGLAMPVPAVGRRAELEQAHAAVTGTVPTVRQDAIGSDEKVVLAAVPAARVRTAHYTRRAPEPSEAGWPVPWETVVCAPLNRDVPEELRVRAAVSVHRGLIKRLDQLGLDVPPCVTGHYPSGQPRPANGASIQFLPANRASWHEGPDHAPVLAVLILAGMPEAADAVEHALQRLRPILRPDRKSAQDESEPVRVAGKPVPVDAREFWAPPAAGAVRWWETEPAAVPDLRPLRQSWSGADTVAASAGLLWRDHLAVQGRGDERSRALAESARQHGVQVRDVRLVPGNASRFVHKTPRGAVIRPYRAVLQLGDLAGDRTVLALGQSRHFGCGLLVPRDELPDDQVETTTRS